MGAHLHSRDEHSLSSSSNDLSSRRVKSTKEIRRESAGAATTARPVSDARDKGKKQ